MTWAGGRDLIHRATQVPLGKVILITPRWGRKILISLLLNEASQTEILISMLKRLKLKNVIVIRAQTISTDTSKTGTGSFISWDLRTCTQRRETKWRRFWCREWRWRSWLRGTPRWRIMAGWTIGVAAAYSPFLFLFYIFIFFIIVLFKSFFLVL